MNTAYENHSMSFFTKLLIGSAIFCVIAVGIGSYLFSNGSNLISADNIEIAINGPVSIPGGEPVTFDITVKNKNNVDLQLADLSVDFPAGATSAGNSSQELKNYRELLGDIAVGGSKSKSVTAIIFGEENVQKQITANVTYSVKGSSATFTKTQSYAVLINSSPINVTVSSFKEITSDQEFDLKVILKSNSKEVLKNILLQAEYPFGYTFISSNIQPLSGNALWKIGDIPSGSERTITLHGKLAGEDTDLRAFHFIVGAQSASNARVIGTQYMAVAQDITIQKPFVSLSLAIDNDHAASDHVGQFGRLEQVQVTWFNNLPVAVSNLVITATVSGSAYDKTSILPNLGYFDSATNKITWNRRTNSELATADAGETGIVSFAVIPKDLGTAQGLIVDPTITITANVAADRTQETNVPQTLTSTVTRNLRVSSQVALSGRILRTTGPFANTGPIPPKAEQTSTYTVVWDVDNTSSVVNNAKVTATLPAYVKWVDAVSPSNENVTFDENTGEVTWNIGNVSTYTLSTSRRREVAFQVSLKPSVTQAGQLLTLINAAKLMAVDSFTNTQLQSQQDLLTTRFSTDPAYKSGDELVGR